MRNYRRRASFVNCAMRVVKGDKIAEPLCDYLAIQDFGGFSDEEMGFLVEKMLDPKELDFRDTIFMLSDVLEYNTRRTVLLAKRLRWLLPKSQGRYLVSLPRVAKFFRQAKEIAINTSE